MVTADVIMGVLKTFLRLKVMIGSRQAYILDFGQNTF